MIYTRVSTEDQAREGLSLDAQAERCRAYLGFRDVADPVLITDAGLSAKNLRRDGVQTILQGISSGTVAGLAVWRLDRLTRSLHDLLDLVQLFERHQVHLVSVTEHLDTTTPMGRLMLHFIGALAQWERETISERTRMARQHGEAAGRHMGGPAPAGMITTPYPGGGVQLVPDPQHGPALARIWPMAVDGCSSGAIAEHLVRAGVPNARGHVRWNRPMAARLLHNRRYIGHLVDEATFMAAERAMARRDRRVTRQVGRTSDRVWVLGGLARCARCGSAMFTRTVKRPASMHHYYVCTRRDKRQGCDAPDVPAPAYEQAAVEALVLAISDDAGLLTAIETARATAERDLGPTRETFASLIMERDRLHEQIAGLVAMASRGGASGAIIHRQLDDLDRQAASLASQIATQQARVAAATIDDASLQARMDAMRTGLRQLSAMPPEDQRQVFLGLCHAVHIDRDSDDILIDIWPAPPKEARANVHAIDSYGDLEGTVRELWRVGVGVVVGRRLGGRGWGAVEVRVPGPVWVAGGAGRGRRRQG